VIVDWHLHLQDDIYVGPEGTPQNVIRMLDGAGIDKAVVFAIWCSTRDSIRAGERAAHLAPDRLIPYVSAVPAYDQAAFPGIRSALAHGPFRGVKLHTGGASLAPYLVDPVLELAKVRALPLDPEETADLLGRSIARLLDLQ
jgi:hypothetical protein